MTDCHVELDEFPRLVLLQMLHGLDFVKRRREFEDMDVVLGETTFGLGVLLTSGLGEFLVGQTRTGRHQQAALGVTGDVARRKWSFH
jgi:hypothetical protein